MYTTYHDVKTRDTSFYTLSYPKSMDHIYVTINMKQGYDLEIGYFSNLLQLVTQTHKINTNTCFKQQGKDTHEFLSRSDTIWLPKHAFDTITYCWVTHMRMCQN